VSEAIRRHALGPVVVDPVMVAKSGDRLLREDAIEAMRRLLLAKARVVTPNLPEAEALSGIVIETLQDRVKAARRIMAFGAEAVVIKGGHASSDPVVDLLVEQDAVTEFSAPRIPTRQTHGTGCTFSAAIAAGLATGRDLRHAVGEARAYLTDALAAAPGLGHGHGPLQHFAAEHAIAR
jgi:hydroxymethylpyrimidine/phosphomethylpyrimidine kinase